MKCIFLMEYLCKSIYAGVSGQVIRVQHAKLSDRDLQDPSRFCTGTQLEEVLKTDAACGQDGRQIGCFNHIFMLP